MKKQTISSEGYSNEELIAQNNSLTDDLDHIKELVFTLTGYIEDDDDDELSTTLSYLYLMHDIDLQFIPARLYKKIMVKFDHPEVS